jgi:excisionase family DNA binding protein
MLETRLTLAEAADRLGVHYQTAYRWVRQGVLPAMKVGGSYEVDPQAVAELARARAEPAPPPARRRVRSWEPYVERLLGALLAGEESKVRELFDRLLASGVSVAELCDHVLSPALYAIGDRWAAGKLSIAEEHRASGICERALARWSAVQPGRPRGVAIVCSPVGDEHQLPGHMATAVLRNARWRVHHLGVGVPADAVVEMARLERADLVVITVTWPPARPEAESLAAALDDDDRQVLVGGAGMTMADLLELTGSSDRSG